MRTWRKRYITLNTKSRVLVHHIQRPVTSSIEHAPSTTVLTASISNDNGNNNHSEVNDTTLFGEFLNDDDDDSNNNTNSNEKEPQDVSFRLEPPSYNIDNNNDSTDSIDNSERRSNFANRRNSPLQTFKEKDGGDFMEASSSSEFMEELGGDMSEFFVDNDGMNDWSIPNTEVKNMKEEILKEGKILFENMNKEYLNTYASNYSKRKLKELQKKVIPATNNKNNNSYDVFDLEHDNIDDGVNETEKMIDISKVHRNLNTIFESPASIHQFLIDFKENNIENVEVDDPMFSLLLSALGKYNKYNPKHVANMYRVFLDKHYDSSLPYTVGIRSYEKMIKIFIKIGFVDRALDLFDNIETYLKIKPDAILFNKVASWITGNRDFLLGNEKHSLKLAYLHFKYKVPMQNIVLYDTLTHLIRLKKIDTATKLIKVYVGSFDGDELAQNIDLITWIDDLDHDKAIGDGDGESEANDMHANAHTLCNLSEANGLLQVVQSLAKNGHYDFMDRIIGRIMDEKIEKHGNKSVFNDLDITAQLVDIYGTIGKFNEGYERFYKRGRRIQSSFIYSNVLYGKDKEYLNSDKFKVAQGRKPKRSLGNKIGHNLIHDPHGFVSLINAFSKHNEWEKILDAYYEIMEEARAAKIVLPLYIVSTVVTACGIAGEWEIACNIYNDVVNRQKYEFVGREFYLHMAMLNILSSVETDDEDLKCILIDQIDGITASIRGETEAFSDNTALKDLMKNESIAAKEGNCGTEGDKKTTCRLKKYRREMNHVSYNAPSEFKDDRYIFMLQNRMLCHSLSMGKKKLIIRDPNFFKLADFPALIVDNVEFVATDEDASVGHVDNEETGTFVSTDNDDTEFNEDISNVFDVQSFEKELNQMIDALEEESDRFNSEEYILILDELNGLLQQQETIDRRDCNEGYVKLSNVLKEMSIPYQESISGNSYIINPSGASFDILNIFKNVTAPVSSYIFEDALLPSKGLRTYYRRNNVIDKKKKLYESLARCGLGLQHNTLFEFQKLHDKVTKF
eukprot:g8602.t1